jgi:hypothetical protein
MLTAIRVWLYRRLTRPAVAAVACAPARRRPVEIHLAQDRRARLLNQVQQGRTVDPRAELAATADRIYRNGKSKGEI